MSRNTKIILVVVGTLGIICALLCVTLVFFVPQFAQNFAGQLQDPANVRRIASEIADFDLPRGYQEFIGMDLLGTQMVAFNPPNNRGIILMLIQMPAANASREQMEQQLRQQLGSQPSSSCSDYVKVGEETIAIKGTPTTLTISECTSTSRNLRMRQEVGVFQGKSGLAMVMGVGAVSEWDAATLRQFLGSIR